MKLLGVLRALPHARPCIIPVVQQDDLVDGRGRLSARKGVGPQRPAAGHLAKFLLGSEASAQSECPAVDAGGLHLLLAGLGDVEAERESLAEAHFWRSGQALAL